VTVSREYREGVFDDDGHRPEIYVSGAGRARIFIALTLRTGPLNCSLVTCSTGGIMVRPPQVQTRPVGGGTGPATIYALQLGYLP